MIPLDMRTIIFLHAITYVICTLFIVQLWRQNRRRFAGMELWVLNFVLQTAALALMLLRGAISDWLSIVLANTLIIAGALALFVGLERFVGRKGSQIHNYALLALYAGTFAHATFVHPDLHWRTLIGSVGLLIIVVQCLWLLWYRVDAALRPLTFNLGVVFGVYGAVSIVRIVEYFAVVHIGDDYFRGGTFQALTIVSYMMILILLTYGLVLMVNKRLLMAVVSQEEKFSKAFHSAPYAVTITRLSNGTIVDVNETFGSITGYDRSEVMGKKTIDLQLWEVNENRTAVVDALLSKGSVKAMELFFRKKSGERITGLFSAELITIEGEKNILASIADITDRKRTEESLRESERRYRELSIVDDLTHLYNSRHFHQQLQIEIDRANRYQQPLTLLLLDLDNFKSFNDAYGHVEGDRVLARIGQVVKRCLRRTDSAYRYGGEEFTIILPMTTVAEGSVLAERIRLEFSKELFCPTQDKTVQMTLSIGLAQYVGQEEIKAFVHRVDRLMYQGKQNGKNRICY